MSQRTQLLDRLRAILVCPKCRRRLPEDETRPCAHCGAFASRTPQRFDFGGVTEDGERGDWLDDLKGHAKRRLGRFYPVAMNALSPVYGDTGVKQFVESFDLERAIVCDLGAGTKSYDDKVVCVDGYGYETVHVVADLGALPFADGSVDGVISEAVLEHVPDPAAHVAEMLRVLRPGGRVLCYFPFIAGFHASPHDYTRLTLPGLHRLFAEFTIESSHVAGGPTSGLLWTLQEWLAMVGSFGNERLYRALVPLMWALSPLKYLDALLIDHPAAHVIASGFAIEATKPASSRPTA